jgi:hypothetical protein
MRINLISIVILSATLTVAQQTKNSSSRPAKHPEYSDAKRARKRSVSAASYAHKRESSANQELAKIEHEKIVKAHPATQSAYPQTRPATPTQDKKTQDKNKKINYSYHASQVSKKPR